jgi:hypothetical protein
MSRGASASDDADEVLLGAIPLEAMDLTVHPRLEKVVGAHGDQVIHGATMAVTLCGERPGNRPMTLSNSGWLTTQQIYSSFNV